MDMASALKALEDTTNQIKAHTAVVSILEGKKESWEEVIKGLTGVSEADKQLTDAKQTVAATDTARKAQKGRRSKPKTQTYVDVIREHGREHGAAPHLTEIHSVVLSRGIKNRKGKPITLEQLRNSLASCTYIENVGGNCYWPLGVPAPDETPVADSEQLTTQVSLQGEMDRRQLESAHI